MSKEEISSKIIDFSELSELCTSLKSQGKRLVHCHGVFDLLHPGHFKHFIAAKAFGDVLIVTLTEDKHVNKGPDRPIFKEPIRAETIAAVGVVDYVAINRNATAIPAIQAIKPDAYVKGQDYEKLADDITGGIYKEKSEVEKFGGKLVFTHEEQFSSSKLINSHIDLKNKDLEAYLKSVRLKFTYDDIQKHFDAIAEYEVVVIGDVILDEYQFVRPLGKSSKSATITARQLNTEIYAGGVLAVANHIADFVKKVTLVTTYGINNGTDYFDLISKKLHANVELKPIFTPDRPTTLKRRLVDGVFKQKLFEVIEIDDSPLSSEYVRKVTAELDSITKKDIVVVADFGHGLIDNQIVEHLVNMDTFLSVNSQTNSANKGFNVITKYPRCNYFSIDKEEAQLAVHDKTTDIEITLDKIMKLVKADFGAITLGVNGCVISDDKLNKFKAPVLSNEVVDTIGAGDAFLSITSLLIKSGMPPEQVALIGNAVGAMAVKILGNKDFIQKVPLLKYIKTLLA